MLPVVVVREEGASCLVFVVKLRRQTRCWRVIVRGEGKEGDHAVAIFPRLGRARQIQGM
jgi:hypothetical protein